MKMKRLFLLRIYLMMVKLIWIFVGILELTHVLLKLSNFVKIY